MGNTLIVSGSGPTREAAILDLQGKLQFVQVQEFAFQSQEYDAGTGLWTALAMAVLREEPAATYTVGTTEGPLPEKRTGVWARFWGRGGGE